MASTNPSVFDLSSAEKLQLVEDLWDDIATNPADVPIHDWQKAELERRKARLHGAPGTTQSWEQVRQRIRAGHGR